ncbi:hypothetical protein L6R52_21105 [Myxococcota bacterium]|nr:hypothetical protein [Myxococcota bacterium]
MRVPGSKLPAPRRDAPSATPARDAASSAAPAHVDVAPPGPTHANDQARDPRAPLGPRVAALPAPVRATPLPAGIDAELRSILPRLTGDAELTDAELSALRSQLALLDRRQLQLVRRTLDRALPAARKDRVRADGALVGPVTLDKVMALFGGPGRLGRLSYATKETLREVRESNVDALLARAALRLVNGNDGLFVRLNPGDAAHPEGFVVTVDGRPRDSIDQRYALLEVVSSMLRVGFSEKEIREITENAARPGAEVPGIPAARRAEVQLGAVLTEARARIDKRAKAFEQLAAPADLDHARKEEVSVRLSQVRWLEARVAAGLPGWKSDAPESYRADLQQLLGGASAADVHEAIDARYERVMNFALDAKLRAEGLEPLATVKVERLPAERVARAPDVAHQALAPDHPVRQRLEELDRRLARGERSAVGEAYATQTFPVEVLDGVARGDVKVVAFDGARDNGVRYIRDRWGTTADGLRLSCRLMGLQGVYGSYPRTLVTLDDGQKFLLLSGYGGARQLNNAGALLLYQTPEGRRASAAAIELASDGTDFTETVRADLRAAITADWGDRAGSPDEIPTRLLILQNPAHLEHLLGDQLRWAKVPEGTLVPFFVGYRTHDDGREERIVIPKVGGGGVYGDTAGQFITAFFTSGFENLSPDVLFNGTAGGFAGTRGTKGFEAHAGLPDVEPGGLFMPTREVEQYGDGRGPLPMPSMLPHDPAAWPPVLRDRIAASGVHLTGRHVAISAPAIETFPLIHGLVERGHASVDVEAGAIMDAARNLGKTCTVVYTHSDDPRASEEDPNASLGMVGPFLEGSRYHQPLFELLKSLWDHSWARPRE